jgi:PhnB protein
MKNNLLFNFIINKENNTVNVEREFAANLDRVWDAWTKPEILDQWWAPKPYKAVTKSMDFREGGMWFYYMLSPENQKHWRKNNYQKIQVKK